MDPLADETKKQEIIDQLVWNDSVNANDILVTVEGNLATLEGRVPSYAQKLTAEREAFLIAGITHVENLLDVAFPAEVGVPGDEEIADNVRSKMLWNDQLKAEGIVTECYNGVITLTGNVDSYWERNLAEEIAISSAGVFRVVNDLKVIPEISALDEDIKTDIISALRRNNLVDENLIGVDVENGTAHLQGTVPSYPIKREALNIAAYTAGVVDIIDDIRIA